MRQGWRTKEIDGVHDASPGASGMGSCVSGGRPGVGFTDRDWGVPGEPLHRDSRAEGGAAGSAAWPGDTQRTQCVWFPISLILLSRLEDSAWREPVHRPNLQELMRRWLLLQTQHVYLFKRSALSQLWSRGRNSVL